MMSGLSLERAQANQEKEEQGGRNIQGRDSSMGMVKQPGKI